MASSISPYILLVLTGVEAPKGLSAAEKQAKIVSYLRSSCTVHTLKELEKALPSIASINGMQVKDFLTALQNENMITVEKIGSGNWYWSFASDEAKSREATLEKLRADRDKLSASIQGMKSQLSKISMSDEEKREHQQLMEKFEALQADVARLETELDGFRDGDPVELERKRQLGESMKASAETWTDNIYILEQALLDMVGGDRDQLEAIKRETYGDEYVEGERLREWT